MNTGQPAFKNPTIAEALCEIHFTSNLSSNPDNLETSAKSLGAIYPVLEKKEIREVRAEIGPGGVSITPTGQGLPRLMMRHAHRNHIVQVSPGCVTINELDRYPGWETFLGDIKLVWEHFSKDLEIYSVQRIGLRYINKIPRQSDEPVAEWLGPSEFYPNHILRARSHFASRFESMDANKIRTIITLAEGASDTGPLPLIFDIDCIAELNLSSDWASLLSVADDLHRQVWRVFKPSITPRLKNSLEKGEE